MIQGALTDKITLAIGDGANDVAMLTKAHIGIGLAGKEGMQAARAADYSFGKFKFLRHLLFVHGRECYRRNADIVCYNFYKNILYILAQMIFNAWAGMSGQVLYEPWIYQLYNFAYTGAAIMIWGVMDFEHSK